ncbi:hypothetical protein BIWAKO_04734 [Bosea sp. BIWAKO-01]|nr:hypothetical protein BIWAKO_04734 [Bosea sp. BIWAKO-01]
MWFSRRHTRTMAIQRCRRLIEIDLLQDLQRYPARKSLIATSLSNR